MKIEHTEIVPVVMPKEDPNWRFALGGEAKARGFIDLLNRRLGIEVCLWNPFDSERCQVSRQCEDLLKEAGPIIAVAAGLAMRSI